MKKLRTKQIESDSNQKKQFNSIKLKDKGMENKLKGAENCKLNDFKCLLYGALYVY